MLLTHVCAGIMVGVIALSSISLGLAIVTDGAVTRTLVDGKPTTIASKGRIRKDDGLSPWETRPLVMAGPKY
jgi:hypothetical protein